jgi:Flp pilus assembly pilin Flp
MIKFVDRKNNEKGQGLVEYALIVVLVAVVIVAALLILGPSVGNVYGKVNASLANASSAQSSGVVATATSAAPTWTTCANENGYCSFSGTAQVRYGAGSSWTIATFTNGVACNNSVFGDPDFGVVKTCQVSQ